MSALSEALRAHSDLRTVYWWQSRSNLRNPPILADLEALARQIHKARK